MKSLALLGLLLVLPSMAVAEPQLETVIPTADAERARTFLERRHTAVMNTLQRGTGHQATPESVRSRLAALTADLFDFNAISRQSLGEQWNNIQPVARAEFVSLLTQLVERSYQDNLESTAKFKVKYGDVESRGDHFLVKTLARSLKNRRAPAVSIDYEMRASGEGFRVHDITTDGVSLVTNYKRQFSKIIRRHGWEELLVRMRKRLADKGSAI